jgi:alcohol dehydrogenase
VIVEVGSDVRRFRVGERVTAPFICACGTCEQCECGNHQVCEHQEQPGFTHWGSFAELVALRFADTNLVRLPDDLDFVTAASLGCRFATSFRAVVHQARIEEGQWLVVYGCGGVGLSAVMIASAMGAQVVAVDIDDDKLALAVTLGACATLRGDRHERVADAVRDITGGGAHCSIDALGSPATCRASIEGLRRRGRHVQIGLLLAAEGSPPIPMSRLVAHELEIVGSHGMQAHLYPQMLDLIAAGRIDPSRLVGARVTLEQGVEALESMDSFGGIGATVIDRFGP